MKLSRCPRKDAEGNHFVHEERFNWYIRRYRVMCNSQGRFKPVDEVHAKRPVAASKKRRRKT